jgi:hypothetical protein
VADVHRRYGAFDRRQQVFDTLDERGSISLRNIGPTESSVCEHEIPGEEISRAL